MDNTESVTNQAVLELIQAAGDAGAISEDLARCFYGDEVSLNQRKGIGSYISALSKRGDVYKFDNRWFAAGKGPGKPMPPHSNPTPETEHAPEPEIQQSAQAHAPSVKDAFVYSSKVVSERPFQRGWEGTTLKVQRDAPLYDGVIRVELKYRRADGWHPVPTFVDVVVHLTKRAHAWGPQQVLYTNVEEVAVEYREGEEVWRDVLQVMPSESVVIVPLV